MATSKIRGFVPVRNLDGSGVFPMTMRPTLGNNNGPIFPGDVVLMAASGGVDRYPDTGASALSSRIPLGVVGAVFNTDLRPFTFNQPGAGPFIPTSTRGFAGVYENPHTVFTTNVSATATYQHVGTFQLIRATAPSTAVGRSGMSITLAATITAAGEVAKIVNISPTEGDTVRVSGETNQDVEVILVQHMWKNEWRRNFVGSPASAT